MFFYLRHRRQKEAEKRIRNPDGVDPYQSQRPSMYGPPVNPYTPYVSFSFGAEPRDLSERVCFLPESLRSINVPSPDPESAKLSDIYHPV